MMGTMFCQYETPCGWCTRLNKECPEKGGCKKAPNRPSNVSAVNQDESGNVKREFMGRKSNASSN